MGRIERVERKGLLYFTAFCFALLTLSLAIYPKEGLTAAKEGLAIFGEVVLPSLLPFFILSEVLLGLGVVHFIGVFLEPLMRPVFNVPGVGAFALSMGLAAGYPMDAVITAKFRRLKLCSKTEGERLLAFTNTADPLFMFGAVAVGMFGDPELGVTIAIAHYLAAFSVGFIFRFYGREERLSTVETRKEGNIIQRALQEMLKARQEDNRPFGQLMADAVKDSISTLLMIGGFIVLFAVLCQVLEELRILRYLLPGIEGVLKIVGLDPALGTAVVKGFFEIDIGTMEAAKTATAALGDRLIIASAVIAWSGLSVLGQVMSVIHGTDLRVRPFIIARLLHAVIAGAYTYLLLGTVRIAGGTVPAVRRMTGGLFQRWSLALTQLLVITGLLLAAGFILRFLSRFRLVWRNKEPGKREEKADRKTTCL
ncbi:MAG: sporulation integral membrane protein YlbJ [Firmicutes bacterium]|nr:sporulation integral membrane protein YlbJ [Bacillota bacterium]